MKCGYLQCEKKGTKIAVKRIQKKIMRTKGTLDWSQSIMFLVLHGIAVCRYVVSG